MQRVAAGGPEPGRLVDPPLPVTRTDGDGQPAPCGLPQVIPRIFEYLPWRLALEAPWRIRLSGARHSLLLIWQIIIDAERPTGLFPAPYVVIWPAGLQPR